MHYHANNGVIALLILLGCPFVLITQTDKLFNLTRYGFQKLLNVLALFVGPDLGLRSSGSTLLSTHHDLLLRLQ